MNKRDILLVGAGLALGYFLVTYLNKNKSVAGTTSADNLPDVSAQTLPPSVAGETLVDPKVTACEAKWAQHTTTARFGSAQQMQQAHDSFIADCLKTQQ